MNNEVCKTVESSTHFGVVMAAFFFHGFHPWLLRSSTHFGVAKKTQIPSIALPTDLPPVRDGKERSYGSVLHHSEFDIHHSTFYILQTYFLEKKSECRMMNNE